MERPPFARRASHVQILGDLDGDSAIKFAECSVVGEKSVISQASSRSPHFHCDPDTTPGFAIEIKDDCELCGGMLIAEMEGGSYEPVGLVIGINEAIEVAQADMRYRMKQLDCGGTPACPGEYVIWARGIDGDYRLAKRFMP